MNVTFAFLLFVFLQQAQSANILFFFQLSTFSHRIPVEPLMEALADRGHNVTFFHPYKPRSSGEKLSSKVHEFLPASFESFARTLELEKEKYFGNFLNLRLKYGQFAGISAAATMPEVAYNLCNEFLSNPDGLHFMESSSFDLILIDGLFNECAYGLAHKFGAKTIIFGTSVPWQWHHEPFDVVQDTSYLPDPLASFQTPMTFSQRLVTTVLVTSIYFYKTWFYYPKLDELFRNQLGMERVPGIEELEKKTSLILYNSHFSEEVARALPPMFVAVGGMHCDVKLGNVSSLSTEMKKFMDESEGFIYVSFGSEAKISETPKEFQKIFFDAFESSKVKFLWKWEGPLPDKIPPNVLMAKWMPQKEILAHKNCKAFITHGGLLSIQESITFGVPMIVFPIFAEQDMNAYRIERTGRGISLESRTLKLTHLQNAITEIRSNPKFKENVMKTSKLFKDRPQSPLDTAVYWTEYVLRHDADVLKSPATGMYWFERRLLDVWGFIFILAIAGAYFQFKFFLLFCRVLTKCVFPKRLKAKRS